MKKEIRKNLATLMGEVDKEALDNFFAALDSPIDATPADDVLQVFRTSINEDDEKGLEHAIREHKFSMVGTLIFSKQNYVTDAVFGRKLYCMSGFKEQMKRLPDKNDEIRVIKGNRYFDVFGGYINSEIGFEIIRKDK